MTEDDDAPPALPGREPGETARRIAAGHARNEHFPDWAAADLASVIQAVMDAGQSKAFRGRTLYWDRSAGIAVIVNANDPDGGTAFMSDERYFEKWGR